MDDSLFVMAAEGTAEGSLFRLGTVTAKSTTSGTGGLRIKFDGEESASDKYFKCNRGASFATGNRVLCARVGGTWVALCVVGVPT